MPRAVAQRASPPEPIVVPAPGMSQGEVYGVRGRSDSLASGGAAARVVGGVGLGIIGGGGGGGGGGVGTGNGNGNGNGGGNGNGQGQQAARRPVPGAGNSYARERAGSGAVMPPPRGDSLVGAPGIGPGESGAGGNVGGGSLGRREWEKVED